MHAITKLIAICCLFGPMLSGCVRAQTVAPWSFHDVIVNANDAEQGMSEVKYNVDRIHLVSGPEVIRENALIDNALRNMLGHVVLRDPYGTVEVDTVDFRISDAIRVIPLGNLGRIDVYIHNQSDHFLTVNEMWVEICELDDETGATVRRIPWCSVPYIEPYPGPGRPDFFEVPGGGQAYTMEPGEQVLYWRNCSDTKNASALIVSVSSDAIPSTVLIEFDCENPRGNHDVDKR